MKSYEYAGASFTAPRSHPWIDAADDPAARYHDLRAHPELIRTALEDLVPWRRYPAIEQLQVLIEWLNGPVSPLETNDCAFDGPRPDPGASRARSLECTGRVAVLFRDLPCNQDPALVAAFTRAIHVDLATHDRTFALGAVGTTVIPVRYRGLPGPEHAQLGEQLILSFWAWGATEAETMAHLGRVVGNLARALRAATVQLAQPGTRLRTSRSPRR